MRKDKYIVKRPALNERCEDCPNPCSDEDYIDSAANAMLAECRSFYYLYKRLEEKMQIPPFTGDQDTFIEAARARARELSELPDLLVPKVVNGSIACEIALKYLILKQSGAVDPVHRFDVLFNLLPQNYRDALLDKIYNELSQDEKTFNENLKKISNSFIDWRYAYERNVISIGNFFNDFVTIVCEYALSFSNFDEQQN